jgi:hypothetical protein
MSPTPKATHEAVPNEPTEKEGFGEYFSTLYVTGVERMAEAQKKGIDLAVAQNSDATEAWKKMVHKVPGAPGLFMLDLAKSAFEQCADLQKSAIDAMVEQSHALAEVVQERTTVATNVTENAANFVRQSVERTVGIQKKALEYSAAQAKTVFDTFRQEVGFTGAPAEAAADSFHRGVDTVVEAQKELLDIAVH